MTVVPDHRNHQTPNLSASQVTTNGLPEYEYAQGQLALNEALQSQDRQEKIEKLNTAKNHYLDAVALGARDNPDVYKDLADAHAHLFDLQNPATWNKDREYAINSYYRSSKLFEARDDLEKAAATLASAISLLPDIFMDVRGRVPPPPELKKHLKDILIRLAEVKSGESNTPESMTQDKETLTPPEILLNMGAPNPGSRGYRVLALAAYEATLQYDPKSWASPPDTECFLRAFQGIIKLHKEAQNYLELDRWNYKLARFSIEQCGYIAEHFSSRGERPHTRLLFRWISTAQEACDYVSLPSRYRTLAFKMMEEFCLGGTRSLPEAGAITFAAAGYEIIREHQQRVISSGEVDRRSGVNLSRHVQALANYAEECQIDQVLNPLKLSSGYIHYACATALAVRKQDDLALKHYLKAALILKDFRVSGWYDSVHYALSNALAIDPHCPEVKSVMRELAPLKDY